MNPWLDAIDKLRLLGYSVNLDGGKLRYTYQDKGNPSQKEITPLLEVLKAHKAEILKDPCFLIEQTIQAINEKWEPGTLGRPSPEVWERVKTIEREINRFCPYQRPRWIEEEPGSVQGYILSQSRFLSPGTGGVVVRSRGVTWKNSLALKSYLNS